jgi:hypothetical protein
MDASTPQAPLTLSAAQRTAADGLAADLQRTFGTRLRALVAYGLDAGDEPLHTLALVDRVTFDDLAACLPSTTRWRRAGLAVPLFLGRDEFDRSLDVFPVEYGHIVASHVTIIGNEPFAGTRIPEADLRRACELQAKSHLIHLREGFLEGHGQAGQVVELIASSQPAFRALLVNIARLDSGSGAVATAGPAEDALAAFAEQRIGVSRTTVQEVLAFRPSAGTIADPTALLGRYMAATERICSYVDGWTRH